MSGVSAILLAAGASRRMEGQDKLTLNVNGQALVRRTARVLIAADLREIVVVVAPQRPDVQKLLLDLELRIVVNPRPEVGQMSSVTTGLMALEKPTDGVLVALSDQPLLTTEDITDLKSAFLSRTNGEVVIPTYNGQRGNPIVLAHASRNAVLTQGTNLGCRHFIDRHPDLVETKAMANDHFVQDLDTPEDLDNYAYRIGGDFG